MVPSGARAAARRGPLDAASLHRRSPPCDQAVRWSRGRDDWRGHRGMHDGDLRRVPLGRRARVRLLGAVCMMSRSAGASLGTPAGATRALARASGSLCSCRRFSILWACARSCFRGRGRGTVRGRLRSSSMPRSTSRVARRANDRRLDGPDPDDDSQGRWADVCPRTAPSAAESRAACVKGRFRRPSARPRGWVSAGDGRRCCPLAGVGVIGRSGRKVSAKVLACGSAGDRRASGPLRSE
jgi:hypothetical protein